MPSLIDLPDEFLLQISWNLRNDIRDLWHAALVCRTVSGTATEVLYRKTPSSTRHKDDSWLRRYERFIFSVADDPQLSRHVRHLHLPYLSSRGPMLKDNEVKNQVSIARKRVGELGPFTPAPQPRSVSNRRNRRHLAITTVFKKVQTSKLQSLKQSFPSEARDRTPNHGMTYLLLSRAIGVKSIHIGAFRLSCSNDSDSRLLLKLLAAESIMTGPTSLPLLSNLTSVIIGYPLRSALSSRLWSSAGFSTILSLPALRTPIALILIRGPSTTEAWKCLPRASNVRTIELRDCAISMDTAIRILSSCKSLELFSWTMPALGTIEYDMNALQAELTHLRKTLRFLRLHVHRPTDRHAGLNLFAMEAL